MKIAYVLLELIRIHPQISGYDLKRIIDTSIGYFFNAHLSQIYPSLKKMLEQGWVTLEEVVQDGLPDKKLYSITPAGARALEKWLTQPFAFQNTRANADEFYMKLILMGDLKPKQIKDYLNEGIAYYTKALAALEEENLQREKQFLSSPDPAIRGRYATIWSAEFTYIISDRKKRLAWLKKLRDEL